MKINQLTFTKRHDKRRSGRGISAGRGKTAGRGTKGQNARSGGGTRPGFEGGQNPLVSRLPKSPGFKSFKAKAQEVTTNQLDKAFDANQNVTNTSLLEKGLISDEFGRVKLIWGGEFSKSLTVNLQSASLRAKTAIEKAGGKFDEADRPKQQSKRKKD